jgi:hypothetical protein
MCCLSFFFWPLCCLSFFSWPLCRLSLCWPLCCLSFFYAISSDIKWQMLHILTYIPRFSVGILVYANTNPTLHSIYKTAEIDVKTLCQSNVP